MKKTSILLTVVCLCSISAFGTGKGESVTARNVFNGKLLNKVLYKSDNESTTLNYNSKSQLTSIETKGGIWTETTSFDYTGGTYNGKDYDVKITSVDEDGTTNIYVTVGDNLFASSAVEEYKWGGNETTYDTWSFEYNDDGQLKKMVRSEGENEVTTVTYSDGNITKVNVVNDEHESETFSIVYEGMIENKSGIMLYDVTFGIDMDEMELAYFAGLLGKGTRHLPTTNTCSDGEIERFSWALDETGYPIKFEETEDGETETLLFTWSDITGVVVTEEEATESSYYNLQGVRVNNPTEGIYVEKKKDGTAKKIIKRS